MKRKVFSLMMLCLFAFLGLASAQQSDMSVTPNPIDLGYRPIGSWMAPLKVQFTSTTSTAQTITSLEAENEFFVIDANLPGTVSSSTPYNFTVTNGEANPGAINSQLVAITSNRKAYLFDISAVAYEPVGADVFEIAPAITFPFSATVGENVYDNYMLPGNAADGKDVVYKMTIENDVLFTANVDGENGKVAVYTEDFNGEPGPGADNNYEGLSTGGDAANAFEALIGDENSTSTSSYFPFYTLYNYSISEQLYTSLELIEAGVNTTPMASLSFEATNETGKEQKNINIWMANVSDAALTTSSHTTAGMTLVYTGNILPVVGWNEIVFNQNQFAWDGSSNLLICVERTNGEWNSSIKWRSHNAGFNAMAYHYRDNSAYTMSSDSYTVYTSTSRVNTLFKSINGRAAANRDYAISDMTLTPGVYYLAASSTSDEFTVSANIDILPVPEQATNPSPADGQTGISMPAILSWEFGNYTTAYRVLLGTTYPPTNVVVDWTDQLSSSLAVTNLYNNKNYFWRVDEKNSNGYTEGQVWGFTTALNVPQNLTAADEKIYQGDVLELSWTDINDRSYRGYNVYQDGVKINTSLVTTTAYNVSGLTYNMSEGYTFNVTAVYDEGESDFSNDLVAYVTGNGAISGKVTEVDGVAGIAGVEIVIDGKDEFQRPASYTITTDNNGVFNTNVLAGTYTAWASKEGYQAVEYDGEISVTFGQVTPNINMMMQEVLYPVGEVIAEEMSADQVKVYWSQNIMSEVMEDFETGDFSAFNWVNDPTYPWAITTSAYEGSYAMKSTNAGVASSTSAIEVSVEISRDGLMSFYHKISSESNYDKGYFYLDGAEKMNTSGAGNWQQKEYPITAGVHNFKWAYTKDSSVNSNEDCWYVDNISFIHDAEPVTPAEPGWVYYDNGENEDAIGTGGGQFSWGVMFPAGSYTGNTVTKVMAYDYMAMSGTVTIYNDGVTAPANAVGEMNISFTGAEQFVEFTFSNPVSINPSKNLWVIFYNASGATYPAAVCADMGDPNGRWVSIDGIDWMDLAEAGLNNTFMIRAFVTNGKGEPQEITVNHPHTGGTLASSGIAHGHGNRAFNHFNIYRATEGNEDEAELITSVTDTVFFDNEMASLAPGIYKWGVSRVYEGNRGSKDVLESQDFESGSLGNWTSIDADGDGLEWYVLLNSTTTADLPGHNNSDGHATSASYQSVALNPDNYLVSPQVNLGGSISFWACAQDAAWASEKFGVAVSTTSNTSASAFTMLQTWTMTSKGAGQPSDDTRNGNRVQGTWYQYTVDLSAYAGQTGYVAIRHYDCSDWFRLNVDDIVITGDGGSGPVDPPTPPTPPIVGGNESEIVWSNTIEHAMNVTASITVLTNSADSPEGTTVVLHNISEPDLNLTYSTTLDETGFYTWDNMRRGTYTININKDGFEPVEETVEVSDNADLRYVLIEIIAPVNELYVSGTGWAMFGNVPTPVNPDDPDNPNPPTGGWTVDFENGGIPSGWTVIDANNDGYTWTATSAIPSTWTYYAGMSLEWYHNGTDAVCSGSYINGVGALTPDEYLVTPQVTPTSGSTFSFWAAATDASYPADHFGVAVSTTTPTASAFTMLQEWTLTSKQGGTNGGRASRDGNGAKLGNWYNYSVDLSAYAGQNIYIAIRHFNCNDQYIMCVDDVTFTTDRSVEYYIVKLNGETEGTTTHPFFQHNVENLVEGETYITTVQAVYGSGVSEESSFEWVYTSCENFEGLQSANAEWQGDDVVLTWVLPEGGDGPTPPPTPTDVYDFETGTQGWTSIDADGDGFGWDLGSSVMGAGYGHNGSSDLMLSKSYDNTYGVLYPDNYLVSPQVTLGGSITFYACAQDNAYAAEHFGVAVSTSSATASAFTTIQEWTMTAKGVGAPTDATRSGNRTQGNWYQYTVDLSAYAGQTGYVAIRHFNCSDMFYLNVDDIALGGGGDTPVDPPTPPVEGDTYDFETGLQGWTSIDADGDGFGWDLGSSVMGAGYGHNGSSDLALSKSYDNTYGVLYPDNYFVSPQMSLGGSITFYACAQDNAYAAEHFGVAVSTSTATASAFTTIQEWTMTAKGVGAPTNVTRSGNRTQGNWYQYTVDLSNYAGQTGYVAIRHFNCSDMFYLNVDDITIGTSKRGRDTYDFETGMQGWTSIDADGDGFGWDLGSSVMGAGYGHNGSSDLALSKSYDNTYGVLYPDNYLVSPQMTLGGSITFYACAQDNAYAAEHFGVAVSTSSATASAFTTIQEWTMTAKGVGAPTNATRSGNRTQGNWYQYTVDLSSYAGQTGYVAIRHFNCSDMFYLNVDDINLGEGGDTPPTPPDPPTPTDVYDFETGTQGWTSIDADGDGFGWDLGSSVMGAGYGHNGSSDLMLSQSYDNTYGVLYPDNYLVSPQVTLGGSITFYACAQDNAYAAEHFGVAVSTSSATASAFTTIQEWTMTAKGVGAPTNATRSGNRTQGNWYQYTVDLSAYAGQTGYVAIRHFNCSDMFYLNVDDIALGGGGDTPVPPTPSANVRGVEIFRNGEWIAEVPATTTTFTDVAPEDVEYYEIRVVYNGNTEDYTHYTMSCPEVVIPAEIVCIAPENLTGNYTFFGEDYFGAMITWTYDGEVNAGENYYDNGNNEDAIGTGGGQFWWGVMFPAGTYQGSTVMQVSAYDYMAMTGTVSIYSGGTNAPGTLISSMDIAFTGAGDFVDFAFDAPVEIDPSQNLWVILYNASGATYPAAVCANTGDANGRWVSLDGTSWMDLASAGLSNTFMVRAYTSDNVYFEVYRNGQVIDQVPYYDTELFTYFDEPGIGSYQYQVKAVTPDCESDFALTPDLAYNYVAIDVTSVTENIDTRIYPNPTTGIVNIEANGMSHITVVNALGQIVLDTNISGDQYQLNLGQFQAGVYMVRISTVDGVSVQRVTVAK